MYINLDLMVYKTTCLFFFFYCFIGFTQKHTDPTTDDITVAKELKSIFPDDPIAVLNHTETITFGYNKELQKVTVHQSSNQELINLDSRSEIPLYIFYNDQTEIKELKVAYRTGKKIYTSFKDEYYNDDELFHSDVRVMWKGLTFPLQGYTYNFSYTKNYDDVKYFTSSFFDGAYPIIQKNIIVKVPDWLTLEIKELNLESFSIKKDSTYLEKEGLTQYTYTIENVSAIPKEENKPGPSHFRPHLLYLAKSHSYEGTDSELLKNTDNLYNWYKELVSKLEDNPEIIKEKTLSIIKDCTTNEEKIKAIYYWVQDNIRYIAFEDGLAGFKPDESQHVYNKKYGDCKGMANLTKQMLQIAGIDARLTWIGTKRIAYDYSTPTIAVDNHMICTAYDGDQQYFLDATQKYQPLSKNAERIQDKQVLIEDGENYILDKVPAHTAKDNTETFEVVLNLSDDILSGKVIRSFEGESKAHFLYNIHQLKSDKRDEIMEWYVTRGNKNLTVQDLNVSDINDREGQLTLDYNIDIKNAASSFDNEVYIDIDHHKTFKDLDFEKRTIDYLFPYKTNEISIITLNIPSGYIIKELPEDLMIKNPDFEIAIQYTQKENQIVYSKKMLFANAKIGKSEINSWKEFHKKLKTQYQQQIILTKK